MRKNVKYILTTAVSWRMICPRDKSIFERGISNDYFIQNTYRLWLEANPHDAPYHRICVAKKGEFMPRTKKKITAQSKKPEPGRKANGMGSLRQIIRNGNAYWEGRFSVKDPETGKLKQHSVSGKNKTEVEKKLRKALVEAEEGTYVEPSKMTVGQTYYYRRRLCYGCSEAVQGSADRSTIKSRTRLAGRRICIHKSPGAASFSQHGL